MTSSEDSEADDPCAVAIEPGTIDEIKPVCVEDGWPTAARISGMLLQQSVPWWWLCWFPWEVHRIERQHCIACCSVSPKQSTANAPRAAISNATRLKRTNRIAIRLEGVLHYVKVAKLVPPMSTIYTEKW